MVSTLLARRAAVALSLCASLSGCTSLGLHLGDGINFDRPPPPNTPADLVAFRWRAPLVSNLDVENRPRFRGTPAYDAAHDVVFVGAHDRGLHAFRGRDGAELWRFQTLGAVEGTPVLVDDVVYVGSDDGAMYAINARNGRLVWRYATTAEVIHPATVTADSVYFVNSDDSVFGLDRSAGTARWRYHRTPPGGITASGHAGLLHLNSRLVTAFSDGNVVALNAIDGTVAWERDTAGDTENTTGANEAHRTIDVDTTPVLADDTLFAASYTAGLYALDPNGGGVRWRIERYKDICALATDGESLFATSATLGFLKLDASDGSVLWARDLGSRGMGQPVIHGGEVFVPTLDQALWAVRIRDGEPLLGLGTSGTAAPPLIADNQLFFSTNASVLLAYSFTR